MLHTTPLVKAILRTAAGRDDLRSPDPIGKEKEGKSVGRGGRLKLGTGADVGASRASMSAGLLGEAGAEGRAERENDGRALRENEGRGGMLKLGRSVAGCAC